MSVTLTQRVTIRYSGSFSGEILGNTISSITRTEINIEFLDDVPEVLMVYAGNFRILRMTAKNNDFEIIKGSSFKLINDEVQRIKAQWDESTQKWEDYNQSNKYHRPIMSTIEYKSGDDIVYKNAKGKLLTELPLRQKNILNKIRGNYGK